MESKIVAQAPPTREPCTKATRGETLRAKYAKLQEFVGRLLCRLGLHDFRVIDVTFGFGAGGSVERVECRRCGLVATRQA